MSIAKKLKKKALTIAGHISIVDVRIGLTYTAVLLNNGQLGVAYTFHRNLTGGCSVLQGLRPLAGRSAPELLALFDSTEKVELAVALATSNALSNSMKGHYLEGDVLEHLELRPDDRVGMVGYFAPLVPLLRKKVSSLKIFEQIDEPKGDLLPERDVYKYLPQCQVALVTSTAIVNHTIDGLLDAAQSCREVVLLGASTPLVREAFAGTPVTVLSGVVVTRPDDIMRVVSEGGGMRLFKNYIKKVNISLK